MMKRVMVGYQYVGFLPDGQSVHVDADHFVSCLSQDREKDAPLYKPQTWLEAMNESNSDLIWLNGPESEVK